MNEFFKRAYEQVYDLPNFHLGIENELYCHVFSIFMILALALSFILIIREFIRFGKREKINKEIRRQMEKNILSTLEEKDKNKKAKNL